MGFGLIWKWLVGPIAGPVLAAALALSLAALGVTWTVQRWEISRLTTELATTKDAIDNPVNGWVHRFDQCQTNYGTIDAALKRESGDIAELAAKTDANQKALAASMATATARVRDVKTSTDKLLAAPPSAPVGTLEACRAGARILKPSLARPAAPAPAGVVP